MKRLDYTEVDLLIKQEPPLSSREIELLTGIDQATVAKRVRSLLTLEELERRSFATRSRRNHRGTGVVSYRVGTYIDPKGYIKVRVGGGEYEYEHVVVWCKEHRKNTVPYGLVIHHIDGNRSNNTVSNLWAMTSVAHKKLHLLESKLHRIDRKGSK